MQNISELISLVTVYQEGENIGVLRKGPSLFKISMFCLFILTLSRGMLLGLIFPEAHVSNIYLDKSIGIYEKILEKNRAYPCHTYPTLIPNPNTIDLKHLSSYCTCCTRLLIIRINFQISILDQVVHCDNPIHSH